MKTIRDAAKRPPAPDPLPLRDAAPDILQLRVPVETGIDHNNVYLVREKDGWLDFDTGMDSPAVRATWAAALAGPLAGGIRRIVVSHHHPDHLGLAAWLQDATGADVYVRPEELEAAGAAALRAGMTGFELSEAVFGRFLDLDNRMLALMETLAHLQWLCDAGEVVRRDGPRGWRYEKAAR